MTEQPLTQAQDHDRRIGRLEGIAEQTAQAIIDSRQDMRDLRQAWYMAVRCGDLPRTGPSHRAYE